MKRAVVARYRAFKAGLGNFLSDFVGCYHIRLFLSTCLNEVQGKPPLIPPSIESREESFLVLKDPRGSNPNLDAALTYCEKDFDATTDRTKYIESKATSMMAVTGVVGALAGILSQFLLKSESSNFFAILLLLSALLSAIFSLFLSLSVVGLVNYALMAPSPAGADFLQELNADSFKADRAFSLQQSVLFNNQIANQKGTFLIGAQKWFRNALCFVILSGLLLLVPEVIYYKSPKDSGSKDHRAFVRWIELDREFSIEGAAVRWDNRTISPEPRTGLFSVDLTLMVGPPNVAMHSSYWLYVLDKTNLNWRKVSRLALDGFVRFHFEGASKSAKLYTVLSIQNSVNPKDSFPDSELPEIDTLMPFEVSIDSEYGGDYVIQTSRAPTRQNPRAVHFSRARPVKPPPLR